MHFSAYRQLSKKQAGGSQPRIRLIMFGFAGGRIGAFAALAQKLPPWIEVWGAEYPGRGLRWTAGLAGSFQSLLDDLLPGVRALSGIPTILLGCSMGSAVAYRLALELEHQIIGAVFLSALPPGQGMRDWRGCPDREILEFFTRLGGIPPEILSNGAFMQMFLPVLRADLACCFEMNSLEVQRLRCSILAMYGNADPTVNAHGAAGWTNLSGGRPEAFLCRAYTGGHFFFDGREDFVASDIAAWVSERLACEEGHRSINPVDECQPEHVK